MIGIKDYNMRKQTILTSAITIISLVACGIAFNQSRRADNLNSELKLTKTDYRKVEKEIKSEHVSTKYQGTFKESEIKQTGSQTPAESTTVAQSTPQSTQATQTVQSTVQSQAVPITQTVPDYKPNGQYMAYNNYKAVLEQAGYTNIVLDPQGTTSKQADGYVYSVYPNVGTETDKNKEIVITYSVYKAPESSSSVWNSSN